MSIWNACDIAISIYNDMRIQNACLIWEFECQSAENIDWISNLNGFPVHNENVIMVNIFCGLMIYV